MPYWIRWIDLQLLVEVLITESYHLKMFSPGGGGNRPHQRGAPRAPNSYGNSAHSSSNNNKKNKNVFLGRIRIVLGVLILVMATSILYMFQMAHSSSLFPDESQPHSALSTALLHREYSTYQATKKRGDNKNNGNDGKPSTTTNNGERYLADGKIMQQPEAEKQYSEYDKPRIIYGGVGLDTPEERALDQEQAAQEEKARKDLLRTSHEEIIQPSSPNKKESANRPSDHSNHRNYHQNNIFSKRAEDGQNQNHNSDRGEEAVTAAVLAASTVEKDRALQQQKHEEARREALRVHEADAPALDDKRRGGSATATTKIAHDVVMDVKAQHAAETGQGDASEVRAIKAALVLEASKREVIATAEESLLEEQNKHNNNNNGIQGATKGSNAKRIRLSNEEQKRMGEFRDAAIVALRDPGLRETIDPLFVTPIDTPLHQIRRVPFQPKVEYLGTMVDAGRHYFPIVWWKQLIVYLYKLRFNVIHFRFTDDQTFNLQLESYPELANPVLLDYNKDDKKTYTADEVRELVQFAKKYNISIVPEINVPGHAAGFAGIKDLVVMCPEFTCENGYGLPLNVEHPDLKAILANILREVLDIFDNPPFLHLGGDEVEMASRCFYENGLRQFNYTSFETNLKAILGELNYPLHQVVRWERTGQATSLQRAGNIEHFWEGLPGMKQNLATTMPNGDMAPWFASQGLYFDTNHDTDGLRIASNTNRFFSLKGTPAPIAIVAGTFELGTEFWRQRNVAARLIAVAIGASKTILPTAEFYQVLNQTCLDLGIDKRWCDLQGNTATLKKHFMSDHSETWDSWKEGLCDRLTEEAMKLVMKNTGTTKKALEANGYEAFWENFAENTDFKLPPPVTGLSSVIKSPSLGKHVIPITGVIFDLVNSIKSPHSRVMNLTKDFVAPLGFRHLQLRLVDDFGFGFKPHTQPKLGYFADRHKDSGPHYDQEEIRKSDLIKIPTADDFRGLVALIMNNTGIQVIPELTLSTRSGGWIHSGFAAPCPHVLCDNGEGVASAISDPAFMPVIYSVLREFREIFSTSPLIHLGYDDREAASNGCLKEALLQDPMDELAQFEEKLGLVMEMLGIEQKNILRWSNQENTHYSDRTGHITHYQAYPFGQHPKPSKGERFFVTMDLLTKDSPWDIYKETLALVKLEPEGIFGEVRNLDEFTWKRKNVGLRLVAFAMGLQEDAPPSLAEDAFTRVLLETCRASNIVGCDDKDGSEASTHIQVEQSRYKSKMCSEFTYSSTGRITREHIIS